MDKIVVLWIGLAIAVAIYANQHGRSAVGWFVLAVVISPLLAFVLVLVTAPSQSGAVSTDLPEKD